MCIRDRLRPAVCAARASLSAATQLDLDALDRAVAFVSAAGVDDSSSDGVGEQDASTRAPASNLAREEEAYAAATCDDTDTDRTDTDTMALRRSLEGSQVALRRLAADLGSTNTTVAPAPPPPPRDALRRARAPDIIAVDDAVAVDVAPDCLLYTSPSPRDATLSRMPSSA